jgi:2'-hydroxyisoflavone reductase
MTNSRLNILVLGGTAWLGRETARQAVQRGHRVSCLARGESGEVADGVTFMRADRSDEGAYDEARIQLWDAVIEVGWQPGMVREALAALRDRSRHWIYVSSCSVYASHAALGADESADLLPPTDLEEASMDLYGEAKVACELAALATGDADLLIARSGLIGGPGDPSDRAGYWVARAARDPIGAMLVPAGAEAPTQVIDVRDLVSWFLDCAERKTTGIYDAVGPAVMLDDWIEASRQIGGHTGPVVRAEPDWLLANDVQEFMGDGSLPLWIADPDWRGFGARDGSRAVKAGLRHRPANDTLRDALAWELELGLDRARKSGITAEREAELLRMVEGP